MSENNLFAYCLNNPVNMVDEDGELALTIIFGSAALVALAKAVGIVGGTAVLAGGAWYGGKAIKQSILANQAKFKAAAKPVAKPITKAVRKPKPPNLPSYRKLKVNMKHILSGHQSGGNRGGPNKSRFPKWMTAPMIAKAIEEAYNFGSKIQTQGDRLLVRGVSEAYNLVIEIWVNIKDFIIETAYPKG